MSIQRHHEISFSGGFAGALQSEGIEILPETNGRRFQVSTAAAERRFAMNSKIFKIGPWIATPVASLTFHKEVGAVHSISRRLSEPARASTHRCFESARHSLCRHFPG